MESGLIDVTEHEKAIWMEGFSGILTDTPRTGILTPEEADHFHRGVMMGLSAKPGGTKA